MRKRRPSIWRGVVAGAVAGVSATFLMNQFQRLSAEGQRELEKRRKLSEGESAWAVAHEQIETQREAAHQTNSTEIVAHKIAAALGSEIQPSHQKQAGDAVHFSFGTLMGIVYGVTAEVLPEVTAGGGTAFGTVLFLGADEVAVPALRLAPLPTETDATDHLQHWAAHVVYGGGVELVRSVVRRWL